MTKHSAKFQVNWIKDVAGVAGTRYESARAITSSEMAKTKSETICTSSYDKKTIYKISNPSNERRKRSCREKIGRTDGWTDAQTEEGHFYSPPLPTSGDKYVRSFCIALQKLLSLF